MLAADPEPAGLPPGLRGTLARSQLDGHVRGAAVAGGSSLFGALLTLWVLRDGLRWPGSVLWLLLLLAVLAGRWRAARASRWPAPHSDQTVHRLLMRMRLLTLAHGVVWGGLLLCVSGPWTADLFELLVVALGGAAVAGAAVCLMYDAWAGAAFVVPVVLPLALTLVRFEGPLPRTVSVALLMVAVLGCTLIATARSVRRGFTRLTAAQLADAEQTRRSQQAEALLRQVFDHIGEGLCMFDGNQQLVAWNARMVALMGVDAGLVRVGTPLRDLIVDMGRHGEFGPVDPEVEADRRIAAMGRPGNGLGRRKRPDGSTVEVRRSAMPDGGFTLLAVDVSERYASEQALARNRGMLTLLLESTEEGVWFIDNDQRTTDANKAMCRMLGVTREQLLGRSIFDFVDEDNAPIFRDQVRRRNEGLPGSYEIALRRADGALVHCQNNPTPLFDDRGDKVGAVGLFSDVTALKRTADELKLTGELLAAKTRVLESTLQSLSQGVLHIGFDGRIEAWNRRASELTQVPESLLQAHPKLREVVQWQLAQGLLGPADGTRGDIWFDEAQRLAAGQGELLWDAQNYQRQRADGTLIEVQFYRAAEGAQVRTYTDVTASVRAQRALQASESRFRSMADAAPAFIWQSDHQGAAVWFNQAWLRLLCCSLERALSESWRDRIVDEDYGRCHDRFLVALERRQAFEIEFRLRTVDGSECWVADHGIPHLDSEGQLDGYVVYGWDITSRKAAERSLIAARDDAERANRAKSEFLSRMSHELRTPLNAVLGFAQLIEREPSEPLLPQQRERVHQILRGGAHLLDLINEVLDLARIESGALAMQVESVDLDAVVRDCLLLVEPAARQAGITLDSSAAAQGLGALHTDSTRLRQVLLNLLSNAIKYNRPGGRVRLVGRAGPDAVRLEVIDNGPGLTVAQQDRLFQAFERLGAERGSVEGTGIGLALSKSLVDLMGGRIGASSSPGQGSTFWVELPRGQPLAPSLQLTGPAAPSLAPAVAAPPRGRQRQVLYIEDNRVNQILVESMLARLPQVNVTLASEPEQGLAMAFAQPPDLVLLDIQLPVMSGYEVLARLRSNAVTAAVPVIAVTANAMPEDLERSREAGFDDHVTKPLQLDRLLSAVSARLPPV